MKMDFVGFDDQVFSGQINTPEYRYFIRNNFAEEIKHYHMTSGGIRISHDLDPYISLGIFKKLFKLFQKTDFSSDKYGMLNYPINLADSELTYEGEDIIGTDDTTHPSEYLTENSRKFFHIFEIILTLLLERDVNLEEPFYFGLIFGRNMVITRRASTYENLGYKFHSISHILPEGDESIEEKALIGFSYELT